MYALFFCIGWNDSMSELMKKAYYTPSKPGSLGGKKPLKDAVLKDSGVRLSDKEVSE